MTHINFSQQVDKKAIFLLFGCYCINPRFILDEKYVTNANDYPENFHKMIWGALVNIAKKGNVEKISSLDIENEIAQITTATSLWKNNNGWDYIEEAIGMASDKLMNIGKYHDDVRKYSIIRNASEELKMDITFIYDESDEDKIEKFNELTSSDVLNAFTNRFLDFKSMWKNVFGDNYAFKVGEGIKNRLKEHKEQENTYGYPFQSGYLTTVYRGMRRKKFIIRSSISGGGKSRSSLADGCNMVSNRIYDWNKHEWISTGEAQKVLFISTELEKEEIQDIILAHVSGIDQERIETWDNITKEEEQILDESAEYIEGYEYYIEYMPDFTIDLITETIERYIINYGICACFFDYINDSPSLYEYYYNKTHTRLATHQILFLFSASLKSIANKFNIYLGSATQLNDTYKDENNKDAGALKGSKAIIEKADGGILALPVTQKDLKKLKPILESEGKFGTLIPNMAYYIFKNRGGKWKVIVIWTKLNLGTMRESDCFVTDYSYQLIPDIEKTIINFSFEDVGEVHMIEGNDEISGSELAMELSKSSNTTV